MKQGFSIFCLLIVFASALFGQQMEADIIQTKLNRYYFSKGSESGLASGIPFYIECHGDTIYTGVIAYAGVGISYSQPNAQIDSLLLSDDCRAYLASALVDSTVQITLGTDLPLDLFNPEFETLFNRTADSIQPHLIDSANISGKELVLYIRRDIRFSDGSRLTGESIINWLRDLQTRSRSYPVLYFFSKLLPPDSGGVNLVDEFTVKLVFRQPMPRIDYLLSHPDFGVYNQNAHGTGALVEIGYVTPGETIKAFVPNRYYSGKAPLYSKIIIKHFRQSYRMKFEYENGLLDGYFGFGFDEDLAGIYSAKSLYPYIAVMIPAVGNSSFSDGLFPTSIYYRFDLRRAHLVFPHGNINPIYRWTVLPDSMNQRFYQFDFIKGKMLYNTIKDASPRIELLYDYTKLYETGRYVADIVAREGCKTTLNKYSFDKPYDIRLAFFPASDKIIPFALISAVLELNYQYASLPSADDNGNPGWQNLGKGSSLKEIQNRNRFFMRAGNEVFESGSFFPLFRPCIFGVNGKRINGLAFDFYGYPDLKNIIAFRRND